MPHCRRSAKGVFTRAPLGCSAEHVPLGGGWGRFCPPPPPKGCPPLSLACGLRGGIYFTHFKVVRFAGEIRSFNYGKGTHQDEK